jgi:hypothetical protein
MGHWVLGIGHWALSIGHWLFLPHFPHLPYLTESLLLLCGLGKAVMLVTFLRAIKMS